MSSEAFEQLVEEIGEITDQIATLRSKRDEMVSSMLATHRLNKAREQGLNADEIERQIRGVLNGK